MGCGDNYEVNIYGDLDHPAGIEIGFYKMLSDDKSRQSNCISFMPHRRRWQHNGPKMQRQRRVLVTQGISQVDIIQVEALFMFMATTVAMEPTCLDIHAADECAVLKTTMGTAPKCNQRC
jgi:hypothetical protein